MKAILTFLIVGAIHIAMGGWLLMLAVGVVHHEWIPACPTIGIWWACILSACLRGALMATPSGSTD